MSFSIEVRGLSRLLSKLKRLQGKRLKSDIIDSEAEKWAGQTVKTLRAQPYPPKRPGQTYVRKGRLGASWKVEKVGSDIAIVNRARGSGQPYPNFVVGEIQVWFHKGRWWQAQPIIEKRVPKLIQGIERKIEAIWDG